MLENQEECNYKNPQEQECPTTFSDLGEKLGELKKTAGNKAADLTYAQRVKDSYEADVNELEKAIPNLIKIVSEYNKIRLELKQEWDDLDAYYCNKKAMVDVAVGSQINQVKEVIDGKKNDIIEKECTIPGKKEAIKGKWNPESSDKKGKEHELQESQDELTEKTACFEAWKAKQKFTQDTIKSLKDLRDLIELKENEADKSKFVVMFYFLTRFKDVQDKFKSTGDTYIENKCDGDVDKKNKCVIPYFFENDKKFEEGLIKAWCELHQTKKDVLMKQKNLDEAVRDLGNTEDEVEKEKAQLESETLEELKKIEIEVTCTQS